jgi:hypothetical protein
LFIFFPKLLFFFPTFLFFFFIYFFPKIIFVDFTFRILSWLKISLCNFFSLKQCWLLQCFSARFFYFLWFSPKLSFLFYFLILSWLKITVTICEESTVTFLANYCGLL